jgi:hypothetical protein
VASCTHANDMRHGHLVPSADLNNLTIDVERIHPRGGGGIGSPKLSTGARARGRMTGNSNGELARDKSPMSVGHTAHHRRTAQREEAWVPGDCHNSRLVLQMKQTNKRVEQHNKNQKH